MATMDRRNVLLGGIALAVLGAAAWTMRPGMATHAAEGDFEVEMTEAEWQAKLTPEQFVVLRQEGTERPFSSPLNDEHREGLFACAGCDLDLFDAATKFDSGTGWPSFYQPLTPKSVGEITDNTLGMTRTAVFCPRCGGHLGHVFPDGPQPTGLRYCMNGVAMTFKPKAT